jgi:phosphatidylserine/phosphatidylglycerophosphate/cardiolipin synthase-like enzyme
VTFPRHDMSIGQSVALIGSSNLDIRSFALNEVQK